MQAGLGKLKTEISLALDTNFGGRTIEFARHYKDGLFTPADLLQVCSSSDHVKRARHYKDGLFTAADLLQV